MSQIPRFFIPELRDSLPEARVFHIGGPIAHQIGRVLRMRAGDTLVVLDGRGSAWEAELREVDRDAAVIAIGNPTPCAKEPSVQVTLFAAVLKGDRQDWLVQKAVELGVARIQPIVCAQSVVRPGGEKAGRWQRIAREAAEQCERGIVPEVAEPIELARANWGSATALMCTERQGTPLLATLPEAPRLALLIGPEGGWTSEEIGTLRERGALPVSLGPRVLRAETAALAALAAVMLARSPVWSGRSQSSPGSEEVGTR